MPPPLASAEIVEQFQQSLRDKYQAEPPGPEGFLVEVDLVRAQLERSSSKSQEREPVILDWMKRQPAHGGWPRHCWLLGTDGDPMTHGCWWCWGRPDRAKACVCGP